MKNKNFTKNILLTLIINMLSALLFFILAKGFNVFTFLIFSIVPVLISLIVCYLSNRNSMDDEKEIMRNSLIFTIGNFLYAISESIILVSNPMLIQNIIKSSEMYSSEYLKITSNNSNFAPIFIMLVISFGAHYLLFKKMLKGKVHEG